MKKLIFIILFAAFHISCEKKKNECIIKYSNNISYTGYGIVKFNNSSSGSLRYIEFYPICNVDIEKFDIDAVTNEDLNNGIVIRENNNSNLWSKLVTDKRILFDKEKYGIALIYLSFNKKADISKEKMIFTNYLKINEIGFKVRMVDIDLCNINTTEIKIIKNLVR